MNVRGAFHLNLIIFFVFLITVNFGVNQLINEKELSRKTRTNRIKEMRSGWSDTVDSDYKNASPEAIEKWRDLKFGMRIHWGVYSVLGVDASHPLRESSKEFQNIYHTLYQVFNPTDFDADEWAELAGRAGMKYVVFTAKHCDGFCMFDTETNVRAIRRTTKPRKGWHSGIGGIEECVIDYDIMDSPYENDVVAEVVRAFRARGMGIGLYFSHADWNDPDFRWAPRSPLYDPDYNMKSDPEGFQRFIKRHRQQLIEICSNYGKIDQLGFDTGVPEDAWPEIVETLKIIRKLQPDVLMRHRGLGPYGDYQTPEHWIPSRPDDPRLNKPWQAIEQIQTYWAYTPNGIYKSKEWIIQTLIETASTGGNFMVGISPMANGKFPAKTIERLEYVGNWLQVNGEAIYKTRPWIKFKEGNDIRFTQSKDHKYIFAIVLKWPGKTFTLKSISAKNLSKIHMLGVQSDLNWYHDNEKLVIEIPEKFQLIEKRPCKQAYVFKIEVQASQ